MAFQRDIMGGGLGAEAAKASIGSMLKAGVATGTNQATALPLGTAINFITTVPAGTGVMLPPMLDADLCVIFNKGANALLVYPPLLLSIDGQAVNLPVSVPAGGVTEFWGSGNYNYTSTVATVSAGIAAVYAALAAPSGSSLVGYTQGGTGALTKTVQSKLRNTIDLNDYAACDGVTDDTTKITQIIAALPSTGGTIRYAGTPLFSSTITVSKKITFLGDGGIGTTTGDLPSSYFLKSSTLNGTGLSLTGSGIIMQGGGVVAQVGNGGNNIDVLANNITLRDVTVVRAGQDNVRIGIDGAGGNSNSWMLDNVTTYNAVRRNFYVHSGDLNANAGTALNCKAHLAGEDNFFVNKAAVNTVSGLLADGGVAVGLHIGPLAQQIYVVGGDREGNATNVQVDTGAQNIVLLGYYNEVIDNTVGGCIRPDRLFTKQGIWLPVFAGSSTAGTQTYSGQAGTRIRMGDLVFITCVLTLSALDAATAGNIIITGLSDAYPAGFTNGIIGCHIAAWGGFTLTAGYTDLSAEIIPGSQQIRLVMNGSAQAAAFVTKAMASNTSNIQLSAWYPLAQF